MYVLVYLPLLIPVLAAVAARPLSARLEPCTATWLLTAAAVALAACSTAALALLSASAAARAPFLAGLGHYSQEVMRRADPVSTVTGVAAGLLLAGATAAAGVVACRQVRALAESYRRSARLHTGDGVVIVPGPGVQAYALPGWPGRIVVSGELFEVLGDRGLAALLAHERAHLAGHHHLFTTVARLAAAANPLLLPLAKAVDYTVERWADERAAALTGDRRLVATTVGRVALLTPAREPTRAAGLAIIGQLGERMSVALAGPVPRRVAALLASPPRAGVGTFLHRAEHTALLAIAALVIVLTGLSAMHAASDLHSLVELAQAGA
jgi:beta-lactamase regulating signal transducer with metallopeptidase domain